MHNRHQLRIDYNTITDWIAHDALVYALSIDLFINNGLESTQPKHNILEFDSDAHCMIAQLALSTDSRYTLLRL